MTPSTALPPQGPEPAPIDASPAARAVARRAVWLRRAERWLLLAVVGFGLYLRLTSAKMQADLWYDEAYSFQVASRPMGEMMRLLYLGGDTNPPLYTVVLHFWLKIARGDFFVKLLSLLFGTATMVLLHVVGRRVAGPVAGLTAAFLFAVAEWGIYYSIEARPYAMLFFLTLLSTYFYLRILRRVGFARTTRRRGAHFRPAYVAATAAAIYTHWFGLLLIPTHLLGLWIYRRRASSWLGYLRWLVPIGVLVCPLPFFLWNEFQVQSAVGGFSWPGAPDLPYVIEYLQHVVGGERLLLAAAAVVALTAFVREARRRGRGRGRTRQLRRRVMSTRRHGLFFLSYLLVPVAVAYVASSLREEFSFFVFRYFLAYGLGAFLLLGLALARLPRLAALLGALVLAGAPLYAFATSREEPQKPYSRVTRETWPGEGRTALRLHLSPMSYHSVLRYRRPGSLVEDRILWDSQHGMSYVLDYNLKGEMIHPDHLVDFSQGLREYDEFWVVVDEIYPSRRAMALWKALQDARSLERVSAAQYGTVRLERYRRLTGRTLGPQ